MAREHVTSPYAVFKRKPEISLAGPIRYICIQPLPAGHCLHLPQESLVVMTGRWCFAQPCRPPSNAILPKLCFPNLLWRSNHVLSTAGATSYMAVWPTRQRAHPCPLPAGLLLHHVKAVIPSSTVCDVLGTQDFCQCLYVSPFRQTTKAE